MTNEEWAMEIQAGRAGYGELWEQVRRFIRLQAYKYQTLHAGLCERARIELDDLLQCGFLALRDAVEAYDPERGYKLPTYIRYPLQNRFHDAAGIRGNRKRDPLNLAVRLDAPIGDEDGDATLGEQTADERAEADREAVEDRIFREQLHRATTKALDTLEATQRDTIRRRYWNRESLDTIADSQGVSREKVRQNEQKALRKLRQGLCVRLLRPYIEEMRAGYAWRGTGWTTFKQTGVSSVERAAEKTETLIQRLQAKREQSKACFCALLHITAEEYERRRDGAKSGKM